jgi:hypothetical protein
MAQKYIRTAHHEAHEKLTGALFWKTVTESGYNNAGNVKEFADASTRNLVTRARAANGARFVNDEQPDLCHEAYTFLLDEHNAAQERLIKLATQLTDTSQTAAEGTTATVSSISKGKWFPIGYYNIANVTVTGNQTGEMIEGTDYTLEKEAGRIFIEEDGTSTEGEDLTLTFDRPAIQRQTFKTQQVSAFRCNVIIEKFNAFSSMWLYRSAATGYLNVIEFPSQTGEVGTYRVKFTPDGPMTWERRPEAATLPTHAATGDAGMSSSSSSSSSASQSSSSSSSADTA